MASIWTQAQIDQEKVRILAQVNEWRSVSEHQGALQQIFAAISSLDARVSTDRLKIYLYSMHGLISHRSSGLLTPKQCQGLIDNCIKALRFQNIDHEFSKLAYLYADVHALAGQIASKEGDHWEGMWRQLAGRRYLREASTSSNMFHNFTSAQRFLRLGMVTEAEELIEPIVSEPWNATTDVDIWFTAALTNLRILRLKHLFDAADALTVKLMAMPQLTEEMLLEIKWETLCRQTSSTHDVSSMLKAIGKGGTHIKSCYVLEAYFWDQACDGSGFKGRQAMIKNLAIKGKRAHRDMGALHSIACAIHECGDGKTIPEIRLENTGSAIKLTKYLKAIDREALVWVATAKALKRAQFSSFANICLFEYQSISKRISGSEDILGLMKTSEKKDTPRKVG